MRIGTAMIHYLETENMPGKVVDILSDGVRRFALRGFTAKLAFFGALTTGGRERVYAVMIHSLALLALDLGWATLPYHTRALTVASGCMNGKASK